MFSPCSPGIVHITLDVCTKPAKEPAHFLGTRDTRRAEGGGVGKSAQNRLSHRTISGLSDRTRPIDLSRARRRTHDTSRTTRHARHVTHDTSRTAAATLNSR